MPFAVCGESGEALGADVDHGVSTKSTIATVDCLCDGSGQWASRGTNRLERSEGISTQEGGLGQPG